MRHRVVVASALLLLTVSACTPDPKPTGDAAPSTPSATAPPSAHQADSGSVTLPELDAAMGEELAGQRAETRGNASFAYTGGERDKALIVAVNCRGVGTITVAVPVMDVSFPLECGAGEPAVTYNQLAMKSAYQPGTVSVTAPSTVTWAVTVGRGEAAQAESPGTG